MKNIKVSYYTPWETMFKKMKPSKTFCKELSAQLSPVVYGLFEKEEIRKLIPDIMIILFNHPSYFKPYIKGTRNMCWASIMAKSEPLIMCRFIIEWYSGGNKNILPWMDVENRELVFQLHISPDEKKHLFSSVDMLLKENADIRCDFPFQFKMTYGGDTIDFCFKEDVTYKIAEEIESIAEKVANSINQADNSSFLQIDGIAIKGKHVIISVEIDRCSKDDIISFVSSFAHINEIKKITLM